MAATDLIEVLKRLAQGCRELAHKASDDEVAQALRELARDTEETITLFEERGPPEDCPK